MIDLSNATRADCVDAIEQAQLAKHEAHLAIDDLEGDDEKRERLLLLIIDTLDDMAEARHRIGVLDVAERAVLTRQVEALLTVEVEQTPYDVVQRLRRSRLLDDVRISEKPPTKITSLTTNGATLVALIRSVGFDVAVAECERRGLGSKRQPFEERHDQQENA